MRLALATAIALAIAIPVDLAVELLAREAFAVSPDFQPFQGTVAPYTAGGIMLAAVVFAAIRRLARDADRATCDSPRSRSCSRGSRTSRSWSSTTRERPFRRWHRSWSCTLSRP